MDWEKLLKLLFILSLLAGVFFAGVNYESAIKQAEIAELKKEYAEANQNEQKRIVAEFNQKQKELESALSIARDNERNSRLESDKLQLRIKQLSRNAKNAESRLTIRSLETLRRCQEIVNRDSTIIDYCRAALR